MRWAEGRVSVDDSVASPRPASGQWLNDHFFEGISAQTFGLIQFRFENLWLGPLVLLDFGEPVISANEVSWPIEGGLLAAGPGGYFSVRSDAGSLTARISAYRPSLPRRIYEATQLQLHHGMVRLQLLRLRGRSPVAGIPASPIRRVAAAAIDLALCAAIAKAVSRRGRFTAMLGIAIGYHVVSWSSSGRTLGGIAMGQRVVSTDGSRPTFTQAVLRLMALPIAAFKLRAFHDDIAATDVIEN